MSSAREFALPDLGEGLTEAEIIGWLVRVGDTVAVDQCVVQVETVKSVVDIPVPYAGVVVALEAAAGDVVPVGSTLLILQEETPASVLVGYGVRAPVPVSSPAVRRLARDRGVDLGSLQGTGPGGLVTREDVEVAAAGPDDDVAERIPLRGMLGAAADKLTRSRHEIPHVTCWVDAEATGLLDVARREGCGVTAVLARICVAALARFPALNARVDAGRGEIIRFRAVHLSLAVQSRNGLMVPVIANAHEMQLGQLAAEIARLTDAARDGRLPQERLRGGTFTLNNYGVFGVDGATPILNHPEAGMLGVGRITERPWARNGEVSVRQAAELSLTFDHRVCDGSEAAAFLRYVAGELTPEPYG